MNLAQQHKQEHMKIGRYQSWLEDGKLKLYYHEFGNSSGVYCTLSPEETSGLLDLLARHKADISEAVYQDENSAKAR
ncbi:MAG TPA: hypothetical protein VL461_12800 [Dictyobacter sp.]|jgi:hypothetical protein|nr:hypothetical protein [Dictyobacter sp.]